MASQTFARNIRKFIDEEIAASSALLEKGDAAAAFRHLERAHVLGQSVTYQHTRVHWLMLKFGWRAGNWREVFGQIFRIGGASTKTPLGIYPAGNTGGANVSPLKSMPIPEDLAEVIKKAQSGR